MRRMELPVGIREFVDARTTVDLEPAQLRATLSGSGCHCEDTLSHESWKGSSMPSATKTLDSLLPRLEPPRNELHLNATVLEVSEPAQLAELAADGKIRRFLLGRLSDTAALVDPGCAKQVEEALLAGGHTPQIT